MTYVRVTNEEVTAVKCPFCKAKPGALCRRSDGSPQPNFYHLSRWDVARAEKTAMGKADE